MTVLTYEEERELIRKYKKNHKEHWFLSWWFISLCGAVYCVFSILAMGNFKLG